MKTIARLAGLGGFMKTGKVTGSHILESYLRHPEDVLAGRGLDIQFTEPMKRSGRTSLTSPFPDWWRGMLVGETDATHEISKFAGAFGTEALAGTWVGSLATKSRRCRSMSRLDCTPVERRMLCTGHDCRTRWANELCRARSHALAAN